MRKLSYLFVVLVGLTPPIVFWIISRISETYENQYGVPPEGKGFFGILMLGIRGMFAFSILAFICAAVAYRRSSEAKPVVRQIELALFCVPIIVVIALAVFITPRWPGAVYVLTGLLF